MKRIDGRTLEQLRKVQVKKGYLKFALGSCLRSYHEDHSLPRKQVNWVSPKVQPVEIW